MATDQLLNPADPGTVGRREATRSRTEDAVTKHWPRLLLEEPRDRAAGGIYYYHSGALTVQATAHGAGAGFFWVINPVSSTFLMAIRRVKVQTQHNAVLATPTGPRFLLERFTFTGTATGAAITAAKRRTTDATPQGAVRTAATGMTQTAGAVEAAFFPVVATTAVGACAPSVDEWAPCSEDQCVLAAGEGLRFYQADGGTTSDSRRLFVDLVADEFVDF